MIKMEKIEASAPRVILVPVKMNVEEVEEISNFLIDRDLAPRRRADLIRNAVKYYIANYKD